MRLLTHVRLKAVLLTSLVGLVGAGTPLHGLEVQWTGGGGDCLWTNQNNWTPQLAGPVNAGALTFDVTIPEGSGRVCFNVVGASELASVVLGAGSTLELQPGCNLTVSGPAEFGGTLHAKSADFTAMGPGVAYVGKAQTLAEIVAGQQASAVVRLSAETYSATELWNCCNHQDWYLLSASGVGAVIRLPMLTAIDSGFDDGTGWWNSHWVQATNGGVLELPELEHITAPAQREDRIFVRAVDGGQTLLPKLAHVESAGSGHTYIDARNDQAVPVPSATHLPSLEDTSWTVFRADGGSILVGDRLTTLNNTRFQVTQGGRFEDESVGVTMTNTGLWNCCDHQDWYLFSVTGEGSVCVSPSIVSIDSGFDDGTGWWNSHWVQATNGGVLELPELEHITAPAQGEDRILVQADAGGEIYMEQLESFPTAASGATWLVAKGGTVAVGAVNDASGLEASDDVPLHEGLIRVQVEAGGTFTVARDLRLGASATVTLADASTLEIAGDFAYSGSLTSAGSALEVSGDVLLDAGDFQFENSLLMTAGDVTFPHSLETTFQSRTSTLAFVGSGLQRLEIGGLDVANQPQLRPLGNFGWGKMTIGQPSLPTRVQLVDLRPNASVDSPGFPEALYIISPSNEPALEIHPGSTLMLGSLNAYATLQGGLEDLRSRCVKGNCVVAPGGLIEVGDVPMLFTRGDANVDGQVNVSDPSEILGFLFLGKPATLDCDDAADVDDNGVLELTDAVALLGYLFLGDEPPPTPFPVCGEDATKDGVSCVTFSACP